MYYRSMSSLHSTRVKRRQKEAQIARVTLYENVLDKRALKNILTEKVVVPRTRRSGSTADAYSLLELIELGKTVLGRNRNLKAIEVTALLKTAAPLYDVTRRVTARDGGRIDICLSETWVKNMRAQNVAFAQADQYANDVKKYVKLCKSAEINWHAMSVPIGAEAQDEHIDDVELEVGDTRCYYTMIVPLTGYENEGGTHFPALDTTFKTLGGVAIFDGGVPHLGGANNSDHERIFLYAAIFSGEDAN